MGENANINIFDSPSLSELLKWRHIKYPVPVRLVSLSEIVTDAGQREIKKPENIDMKLNLPAQRYILVPTLCEFGRLI